VYEDRQAGPPAARKIALIESVNPAWVDLSRDWYDVEPADYQRALDRIDS
jgi:putative endonuclease